MQTTPFSIGQTVKITWSGVYGEITANGPIHSFVKFPDGEQRSYLNTRLTLVSSVGAQPASTILEVPAVIE
jgi:hypothetical protein